MLDSGKRASKIIATIPVLILFGESGAWGEALAKEDRDGARHESAGEGAHPLSCGDRGYLVSTSVVHEIAFETPGGDKQPEYRSTVRPRLAVGPNNTIHLVWATSAHHEDRAVRSDAVFAREWREGTWGPIVTLAEGEGRVRSRPTTLVARDGSWYVVWEEFESGHLPVVVGRVRTEETWATPKVVSDSSALLLTSA